MKNQYDKVVRTEKVAESESTAVALVDRKRQVSQFVSDHYKVGKGRGSYHRSDAAGRGAGRAAGSRADVGGGNVGNSRGRIGR